MMGNQNTNSLLIVDDSPIIIERVIDSLKDHDTVKSIATATSYLEAMEQLNKNIPSFILLDIQLPGKSGIDLLKILVKDYPSVKVIMFSNQLNGNYIKVCKEIGARYFIDKSKEFEKINEILLSM